MPTTVKEIRLICTDLGNNNNKYWTGKLYDNNDVETFWGRVGYPPDSKLFPGEGESGLIKRANSKKKVRPDKPPYTELQTIEADSSKVQVNEVSSGNLEALALAQIKASRPELKALIGRLVKSNIHKITSTTNISYNASTGLFSTPLGIVTPVGISQARDLLAQIKGQLSRNSGKVSVTDVNCYLRIIPQNYGRSRIDASAIFPDDTAIQKQADILDSLEASYKAVQTPSTDDSTPKNNDAEKIFSLDLDLIESATAEFQRLDKWFHSSKRDAHGYSNARVVNIYKVDIHSAKFEDSLGNLKEVFHGTSEANLLSILKSGFKVVPPATAYIAGDLFGPGIYGAIHSTKSLNYSTGFWGGSRGASSWLFVCDFAMGKTFETKSYGASRPSGYNSIWAKSTPGGLRNDELIVPVESQAKIKYLMEVK